MTVAPEPTAPHPLRAAVRDTLGVGLGLFPLGLAFGVLLTRSGFAWWWTPLFSLLIYAGSLEFLAIGLFLALTPLASVAVTTFLVNFRHVFYGLSFPLHRIRGRLGRAYAVYALTDEAYAIVATKPAEELTGGRMLAIQALCQGYWVVGGLGGALVGTALPAGLHGLDFALTALFVVLAIDGYRAARDVPGPVLGLLCALLALLLAKGQLLVVALGLYVAALTVRHLLRERARRAL
ncbi:branched-chain amino acid ABC transporter permease [Kitasatospora sp. MMS16-BH015]|uniref:AzlC family ABC transporter permease n=1 Tax=Kitasatospora sp. MMS16-BH015 TaxID=2018025 RepID=UPI000CA1B8EE|nr:AzlC family ABC transporter permease [Kitasatospora sp. MMS16-BH015]AUG79991.1 branched-chain amino acid ABC transporter permease [Kitasatospora sp. MMS16-BH015]